MVRTFRRYGCCQVYCQNVKNFATKAIITFLLLFLCVCGDIRFARKQVSFLVAGTVDGVIVVYLAVTRVTLLFTLPHGVEKNQVTNGF